MLSSRWLCAMRFVLCCTSWSLRCGNNVQKANNSRGHADVEIMMLGRPRVREMRLRWCALRDDAVKRRTSEQGGSGDAERKRELGTSDASARGALHVGKLL
jgi:hypothetical protein